MTFEEWLKTQPILSDSHIRIARLAWKAGSDAGYEYAKFICPARECNLIWQDERDNNDI